MKAGVFAAVAVMCMAGLVYAQDNTGLPLNGSGDPGERFGGHLTSRQREVLQLVAEGKSGKQIAAIMGISESNVSTRMGRIKSRLKQKFSDIKK